MSIRLDKAQMYIVLRGRVKIEKLTEEELNPPEPEIEEEEEDVDPLE